MKRLVIIVALAMVVIALGLAIGCDSKSSQDTRKATIEAAPPRSSMTPIEAKRNAKAIERHNSEE